MQQSTFFCTFAAHNCTLSPAINKSLNMLAIDFSIDVYQNNHNCPRKRNKFSKGPCWLAVVPKPQRAQSCQSPLFADTLRTQAHARAHNRVAAPTVLAPRKLRSPPDTTACPETSAAWEKQSRLQGGNRRKTARGSCEPSCWLSKHEHPTKEATNSSARWI